MKRVYGTTWTEYQQGKLLDFVAGFNAKHGYPPTVREMAEGIGVSSTATVQHHLDDLQRTGRLKRIGNRAHTKALIIVESK